MSALTAFGQTITNPGFEANTFSVAPGWVSDNAPITGWTASADAGAGLNPAGGASPYADNGAIPDGKSVAFITADGTSLSTTLSGLTVGKIYHVMFRANATAGQAPNAKVSIDGQEVLPVTVYPVSGANPYTYLAFEFTAAAASQTLSILNDAGTDNTLLVDAFSIAPSNGKWSVQAWTGDADSGVDAQYLYTHAYSFGNSADAIINGVVFKGVAGASPAVAKKFSTTYLGNVFNNDDNNITVNTGTGSATLARDFVYGGTMPTNSYQSITLLGLTPGTEYVATVYSVAFDSPGPTIRWATFSMGEDRLTVNQDQFDNNNGIHISYRYTADTNGTAMLKIIPVNLGNVSIHVYGFSNREAVSRNVAPSIALQPKSATVTQGLPVTFSVNANGFPAPAYKWRFNGADIAGATGTRYAIPQASSQNAGKYEVLVSNSVGSVTSIVATLTVGIPMANASFEADAFASYPGYSGDNPGDANTPAGQNGPITGWTLGNPNGAGINPISSGSAPFADNGSIPQGTNVAFLQADDAITQTVTGLTVGTQYYVHYYENSRASTAAASVEVRLGTNTLIAAHTVPPVGGSEAYHEVYSDVFAASAVSGDLAFVKSAPGGGDSTALLDNVAIVSVPAGTVPFITRNPAAVNALAGTSASFSVQGIGSLPLAYKWMKNGTAIPGAISQTLTLSSLKQTDEADYSVQVSNTSGSATSAAVHLTVTLAGVYGTGVAADGTLLAAGAVDPHYTMITSPDTDFPGPDAIVVNDAWPIQSGVWMLNGPDSKWVGPSATQGTGNAEGDYVYRTTVDLTGYDLTRVQLVGGWAVDNSGTDILVNGASTGFTSGGFGALSSFTITNGLVAGKNTLDFKVNNLPATPNPTALRVDLQAILANAVATPRLRVTQSGSNLSISWTPATAGMNLQSATDIKGPWTAITGAANPYATTATGTQRFFRLAQ